MDAVPGSNAVAAGRCSEIKFDSGIWWIMSANIKPFLQIEWSKSDVNDFYAHHEASRERTKYEYIFCCGVGCVVNS